MRVLYLVPQAKSPERISAYSFLDEEIQALASAGIDAFVLSGAATADGWCGGVRLLSLDARTSLANRILAPILLARAEGGVARQSLRYPVSSYRAAFIEQVAAGIVRRERIELIHSHFAWPKGLGGAMVAARTGRPLVASLRGTDILVNQAIGHGRRLHPLFDANVRRLLRRADRTVYFSNYMRNQALSLGARPESARVVRKGVDLSLFAVAEDRVALREELGLGPRPMILTVAGLIPLKGVDRILTALGRLRACQDFTFVVCGEGPERRNLETLAAELGLADRVVFTGRVDRETVARYFAACDVFVLASIVEAAGNVLFEAMAAGRPVVCTDAGGPAEYVSDGKTGFVVPVGDDRAIATRLEQLLDNPSLADQLGREGRRRTIDQFEYRRMITDLLDLYREALEIGRRGASVQTAPSAASS
jgi:glycosyltransferase involved in cell wall biosynthesis